MRIPALVALLLLGCSGGASSPTRYLLRADPAPHASGGEGTLRVGLAVVSVAPYLEQDGIVVETEPGQVRAASQQLWAEPLEAGLRSYLRAELSRALGQEVSTNRGDRSRWDYAVDVHVDQLHGTRAGAARLDAIYRITPGARAGEPVEHHFAADLPLPAAGYAALVDTEARLVRELAAAIASSLRASGHTRGMDSGAEESGSGEASPGEG